MDKNEYNLKLEEIDKLVDQGKYAEAAAVADQIDWKRVRNVRTLCLVSEIYEAEKRYDDSKALLLRAYRRSPVGRAVLYRLVEVTIQLKQFDEAIEYYTEYVQAAPNDTSKYILKYKIYRGRGSSVDEQIEILKEYLSQEYNEKYAYELAKLYLEADRIQECLATCDDLVLWFHSGKYVIKALELKKRYAPLTPKQQEIYDRRFDDQGDLTAIGHEKQIVSTTGETLAETIMADMEKTIADDVKTAAGENEETEAADGVSEKTAAVGEESEAAASNESENEGKAAADGEYAEAAAAPGDSAREDAVPFGNTAQAEEIASQILAREKAAALGEMMMQGAMEAVRTAMAEDSKDTTLAEESKDTAMVEDSKDMTVREAAPEDGGDTSAPETVPVTGATLDVAAEESLDALVRKIVKKESEATLAQELAAEASTAALAQELAAEAGTAALAQELAAEASTAALAQELAAEAGTAALAQELVSGESAAAQNAAAGESKAPLTGNTVPEGNESPAAQAPQSRLTAPDAEEDLLSEAAGNDGDADALDEEPGLYDPQELQTEVVRSMREIVSGVGMRDMTDEAAEAVDRVIEQSKQDQEAAAVAADRQINMTRRLTMPELEKKRKAGQLSIDDILLSMGDRGEAVREAIAKAPGTVTTTAAPRAGVLSAVDEALLNMGINPMDNSPIEDAEPENKPEGMSVLPESDRLRAQAVKQMEDITEEGLPFPVNEKEPGQEASAERKQIPGAGGSATQDTKVVPSLDDLQEFQEKDARNQAQMSTGAPQETQIFGGAGSDIVREAGSRTGAPQETQIFSGAGSDLVREAGNATVAPQETQILPTLDHKEARPLEEDGKSSAAPDPAVVTSQNTKEIPQLPEAPAFIKETMAAKAAAVAAAAGGETAEASGAAAVGVAAGIGTVASAEVRPAGTAAETAAGAGLTGATGAAASGATSGAATEIMGGEEPSGTVGAPAAGAAGTVAGAGIIGSAAAGADTPDSAQDGESASGESGKAEASEETSDRPAKPGDMTMDQIINAKTRKMPTDEISQIFDSSQAPAAGGEAGKGRMLIRPQLRRLFDGYLEIPGLEQQIAGAIGQALAKGTDRTSRAGNVLIFGGHSCGKTTIATGLAKAITQERGSQYVKMAKIYATDLNRKDIAATIAKIAGGILIVEEAGDLDDAVADQLTTAMEFRTDGLIVMLEDEQRYLHDLLMRHPRLTMKFTSQIFIPVFTVDQLMNFAVLYADDRDYHISEEGSALLRTHISNLVANSDETVNIPNVLDMVDKAINRANKFGRKLFSGKKRYDAEGRVILLEKDFR